MYDTRDYWPTDNWRIAKPFDQGMNTGILYDLFKNIQSGDDAVNSVLIIKNGYIVAEGYFHPFHKDYLEQTYCITKPFIATLIGILIQEGKIKDVHQKVLDFFNYEHIDNPSTDKSDMTIKDLLTNTTGYEWGDVINSEAVSDIQVIGDMFLAEDWGKFCLDREVLYKPGTFFTSNSNGCQLLASIIKNVTGMCPHDYAKEKIFTPLGITHSMWVTSPNDEISGAQGLFMTPRDVAKLGLLYLSNGYWEDKIIINEEWVKESTSFLVETRESHKKDFFAGYGYQWFILSGLPYETYCAYGAFGHFLWVVKDLDLVCITSGSIPLDQHKRVIYNLFKNFVIPACTDFNKLEPKEVYDQLQELLFDIEYPEPKKNRISADHFQSVMNDVEYCFDQDNTFIFLENMFNQLYVKSLTLRFIGTKACILEMTTYCHHYFRIVISLAGNFLTSQVVTKYGEMSISAQGVFENDNCFKIIYYTNYALKNSLKISLHKKNDIECHISNYLCQGIKKGYR